MKKLEYSTGCEVSMPKMHVFYSICRVIPSMSRMRIVSQDMLLGRIVVRARATIMSRSSNVYIHLEEVDQDRTKIHVTVADPFGFGLGSSRDEIINRQLIERVFSAISISLQNPYCGSIQPIYKSGCIGQVLDIFKTIALCWGVLIIVGVICVTIFPDSCSGEGVVKDYSVDRLREGDELKIYDRLQYLSEIEEVEWWDVDDNDIYIGFNFVPEDMNVICNAAAYLGHKEVDFGCHVFGIDGLQYSDLNALKRDPSWGYLYVATYRYGKKQ